LYWCPYTKPIEWAVMSMYVRGIDFVSVSTIFILDLANILTVSYFFLMLLSNTRDYLHHGLVIWFYNKERINIENRGVGKKYDKYVDI